MSDTNTSERAAAPESVVATDGEMVQWAINRLARFTRGEISVEEMRDQPERVLRVIQRSYDALDRLARCAAIVKKLATVNANALKQAADITGSREPWGTGGESAIRAVIALVESAQREAAK